MQFNAVCVNGTNAVRVNGTECNTGANGIEVVGESPEEGAEGGGGEEEQEQEDDVDEFDWEIPQVFPHIHPLSLVLTRILLLRDPAGTHSYTPTFAHAPPTYTQHERKSHAFFCYICALAHMRHMCRRIVSTHVCTPVAAM